jgi:Tfp pilus assembly protein PilO
MEENSSSNKGSKILLILLALVILLLIVWIFIQRSSLTKLTKEKEQEAIELKYELDSVIQEHNKIKLAYGALSDSLSAKDSIIQANAIEIRKLLDTEWEYNKIRKKLEFLQKVAQGYVHQIDSLYTVNRELKAENEKIRQDYRIEQNRTQTLIKDKEQLSQKIDQATFIKAYDVTGTTIKLKGGSKEVASEKASRTDRVKVCFTLGENPLVKPGKRNVYIRITRPDNIVVTKSKYDTFTFNGQVIPYSLREDIDYQGKAMNVCVNWDKKDTDKSAMKGKYTINVYTDDKEIGSGSFELK